MSGSRLETFEKMLKDFPSDRRVRYFLAVEYRKAGRHAEAAEQLRSYIDAAPEEDVGAAWRDLGLSLEELGLGEQAHSAYEQGVRSARKHNHSDLAGEIQALWDASSGRS
jgi:tetratricopeptide (TPR) repeat protein